MGWVWIIVLIGIVAAIVIKERASMGIKKEISAMQKRKRRPKRPKAIPVQANIH